MNNDSLNDILSGLSSGKNSNGAAKKQDSSALLNALSPADRKKIEGILNNPEQLNKILSSQRAQELMKKFGGTKNE